MKNILPGKSCFLLSILASISLCSFAQTEPTETEAFYHELSQLYGANQIPLIGKLNEYQPESKSNHPYLFSSKYQKGTITLHGISYTQTDLLYDIYEQQVVVLYLDPHNTKYGIIPPADFISGFNFGTYTFKRYCFDGICSFYQVVYTDTITCLYSWHKKRSESHENRAYVSYDYHSQKRKNYLLINSELNEYGGNSSFIKIFSKQHKKSISNYLKTHRIDVRNSDTETISKLVEHCQQYMQ